MISNYSTINSIKYNKDTNLCINNCDYSHLIPNQIFKQQIEPRNLSGYNLLNPQVVSDKYDPNFKKFTEDGRDVYTTNDSRLQSAYHSGQQTLLDVPPVDSTVKLDDVYSEKYRGYGQNYKGYSDIKEGDIMYYIDKSVQDSYYQPIFSNAADVTGVMYVDPMSSIKPQYIRQPIVNNSVLNTNRPFQYGLSSLEDTNEFRENLMASQQLKNNQQKYSARWTGKIIA